jgi:hypothetical protein
MTALCIFTAGIWLGKIWKKWIFDAIFSYVINILKMSGGLRVPGSFIASFPFFYLEKRLPFSSFEDLYLICTPNCP